MATGVIYKGQWEANLKHRTGKGKQVWIDGSLYEGHWKNGKAHGIGRMIHADGDVFIGEWANDSCNGSGKYYHYEGAVYEGSWLNDK